MVYKSKPGYSSEQFCEYCDKVIVLSSYEAELFTAFSTRWQYYDITTVPISATTLFDIIKTQPNQVQYPIKKTGFDILTRLSCFGV